MPHSFHIPVLGLGYSIDTPLKVARYGISSVLSIVDDELIERMRAYHSKNRAVHFEAIPKGAADCRSRRITAYLNFLLETITDDFKALKKQDFNAGNDICRYFELLPDTSKLKHGYELMLDYPEGETKQTFQSLLKNAMRMGAIDVNIMAKVDKMNYVDDQYTGDLNTDALSALRGFAESKLNASVVLSAGMNPKLYSYMENFEDFFPDENGKLKKKIILKVSDFRSALIQAKFLAKKGLWVSEFRIESGLNCGGHAFATEGYLLGPILEEFKLKKNDMLAELFNMYQSALVQKGIPTEKQPKQRVSVQGGIGTAAEHDFLLQHYNLDATGWGSPFLLVPEVTNVDAETLAQLASSTESDFYLSGASPLGIQFNNFKNSTIERQRAERIEKGRPGSPCTKKYLCNNTEFTEQAICTASREYQHLKIKSLKTAGLSAGEYQKQFNLVTEKVCLCEGLCAATYLKYNMAKPKESTAVAICPGPNMAYFSDVYSFDEMVGHIYGKINLLRQVERPHIFIKELNLYIDYLQEDIKQQLQHFSDKKRKQLNAFKLQLAEGINYYKNLFAEVADQASGELKGLYEQLAKSKDKLDGLIVE
ncbi:hypothetical protein SRABI27_05050 [Pedobacter sp. Bi27]|uniref:hypothetical protein n=1 Tax=Pedobacter sp. Bi27 TaxID=2822351 RepID=UPI001E186A9C|nr:hypothetical protein [Pedobacter sp. Bi27]CAH0316927.1 hypothetical protein SRABI27_05050 [Pedobacter sp. Bi27]